MLYIWHIWSKSPVPKAKQVVGALSTLFAHDKPEWKPQVEDYTCGFPLWAGCWSVQAADTGKTANGKRQHRCCHEYLFGTRQNRLLFLLREICSHLYSEIKHLHPNAARSFHVKNMVYSRIHVASKPEFSELVPACLYWAPTVKNVWIQDPRLIWSDWHLWVTCKNESSKVKRSVI